MKVSLLNTKVIQSQNGVALITVLLIFSMAAVLSTSILTKLNTQIQVTSSSLNLAQAYQYARGAESFAVAILGEDTELQVDHLNEAWAMPLDAFKIDNGMLEMYIVDMQSLFNLNGLVKDKNTPVDEIYRGFTELLTYLKLPKSLASASLDWIDNDFVASGIDGAEDNHYLSKNPAYRSANQNFIDNSELMLLPEIDAANYRQLNVYVSSLPYATQVNVNTANILTLMTLSDLLDESKAKRIVDARIKAPFESVNDFIQLPELAGIKLSEDNLSVASEFYTVYAKVTYAEVVFRFSSLLQRDTKGRVQVLSRSHLRYENPLNNSIDTNPNSALGNAT